MEEFQMKKSISVFLALALCFSILSAPASAAAEDNAIIPRYTNATVAEVTMAIDNSGLATIKSCCTAIPSTTWIRATTYLEKKVNGTWTRVDILSTDDQWVTMINTRVFSVTKTHQLTSRGTYRAVTTFDVIAGTTETITVIFQATY